MSDQFIVKNKVTNEFVLVKRGEKGYYGVSIHTQAYADEFNKVAGHTAAEVDAAEASSMFGWDGFDSLVGRFNAGRDLLVRTYLGEYLAHTKMKTSDYQRSFAWDALIYGWTGFKDYTLEELTAEYFDWFAGEDDDNPLGLKQ